MAPAGAVEALPSKVTVSGAVPLSALAVKVGTGSGFVAMPFSVRSKNVRRSRKTSWLSITPVPWPAPCAGQKVTGCPAFTSAALSSSL